MPPTVNMAILTINMELTKVTPKALQPEVSRKNKINSTKGIMVIKPNNINITEQQDTLQVSIKKVNLRHKGSSPRISRRNSNRIRTFKISFLKTLWFKEGKCLPTLNWSLKE
jgi:hypothetical protein